MSERYEDFFSKQYKADAYGNTMEMEMIRYALDHSTGK